MFLSIFRTISGNEEIHAPTWKPVRICIVNLLLFAVELFYFTQDLTYLCVSSRDSVFALPTVRRPMPRCYGSSVLLPGHDSEDPIALSPLEAIWAQLRAQSLANLGLPRCHLFTQSAPAAATDSVSPYLGTRLAISPRPLGERGIFYLRRFHQSRQFPQTHGFRRVSAMFVCLSLSSCRRSRCQLNSTLGSCRQPPAQPSSSLHLLWPPSSLLRQLWL